MYKDSPIISTNVLQKEISSKSLLRLISVDFLRGLVMVLMALDHVRDFFTNVRFNPLDLTQTNEALFMTRWITHYCAPVFVFLAGTGAFLSTSRGKSKKELSLFLLSRGIWLIILELTLVRFGWVFNLDYTFAFGQVIWAIGWSMVILSALIFLPVKSITIFGIVMIASHNLFDYVTPAKLGIFGWVWQILHAGGNIEYAPGFVFIAVYPLIPWIGVMAAGYGFGKILLMEKNQRDKILIWLGISLTLSFVIIRWTNIYGNPTHWHQQNNFLFTIFSFIHVEKYPPSFLFLLMTLGPAIASLVLFELSAGNAGKLKGVASKFFIIFGRVPLFYYLIHIPLIHLAAVVTAYIMGIDPSFMYANSPPWLWPEGWGFSLPVVYIFWIGIVLMLYPICLWYANVKRKYKENKWLSYL